MSTNHLSTSSLSQKIGSADTNDIIMADDVSANAKTLNCDRNAAKSLLEEQVKIR